MLLPPLLLVAGVAGVLYFVVEPAVTDISRDDDLCPVETSRISGSVTVLFDLKKPIDAGHATLPGQRLVELTSDLDRNTELQVYTLTDSAAAPRSLLKRLCKPYDNADLQVKEAKDQRGSARDCDDLPAQLANDVRDNVTRFCEARTLLQRRLDALARRPWPEERQVTSAYLVEAIEDIGLEFAERPRPHALYVFSDMMQHAPWYSHLDLEWTDWHYDGFAEVLGLQDWILTQRAFNAETRIEVYYLPRRNLTDQPRAKALHQRFWQGYFEGARVAFHDHPAMPEYPVEPLMHVLSDEELAARERMAVEQLLLQLQQERETLEQEQRNLETERQRQADEARQREAERQRQSEERRQRGLETQQEPEANQQRQPEQQPRTGSNEQAEKEFQPEDEPEIMVETTPESDPEQQVEAGQQPQESEATTLGQEDVAVEAQASENAMPSSGERAASCNLTLEPEFAALLTGNRHLAESRRVNYGEGRIVVRFAVDEHGRTMDDKIVILPDQSVASDEQFVDVLGADAATLVRSWEFGFEEAAQQDCARNQSRTATIVYARKCRGAPIPSCRTLLRGVEFH